MDSLPSSFTIELNGSPVAKVGNDAEDRVQAKLGTEAAVFTLKNGRLECGDWVLGRNLTEDRSFLPKKVLWFKATEDNAKAVQPVTAHEDGDSFKLKFAGAPLMANEGNVFADLSGDSEADARLELRR